MLTRDRLLDGDGAEGAVPAGRVGGEAEQIPQNVAGNLRIWRKNELLTYFTSFLQMAMHAMCLGGVFDVYIYSMSQQQSVLLSDPSYVGALSNTSSPPAAVELSSFSDFVLTFQIRPLANSTTFPPGSSCLESFTCASSIMHFTDGAGNGDCCQVGNRVPFLFFSNATTKLYVDMDVIGQNSSMGRRENFREQVCSAPSHLPVGEWTAIKVKQSGHAHFKGKVETGTSGKAMMMFVNGEQVCTINGTLHKDLPARNHVKAFFGSLQPPLEDLHPPANVELKMVKYGRPASNLMVGAVHGVQGSLALLLACPLGWLGDHTNRYTLLRCILLMALVSSILMVAGLVYNSFSALVAGVVAFAVYQQAFASTLLAILTDNVPRGRRTRSNVNLKSVNAAGMALGPLLQWLVISCESSEDAWTTRTFQGLLCPGWVILPLLAFSICTITPVGLAKQWGHLPNTDEVGGGDTGLVHATRGTKLPPQEWLNERLSSWTRRWKLVAISANVFFVLTLLSNGMTVKYFNLYFTQILKFSPAQLCLLNFVCRLLIALMAQFGTPLALCLGRSNAAVLLHILAAVFTLGIYGGGWLEPTVWFASISYVLRSVCLQTRDPMLSAITMDVVPTEQRARWAALNSIRSLSFAASAVVGGVLADRYGYELSFDVTVHALLISTIAAIPLLIWFPKAEGSQSARATSVAVGMYSTTEAGDNAAA